MNDPAVLVFAKLPEAGRSKTRLAATIGSDLAARFAKAFLIDTLARVTSRSRPTWLLGDEPDCTPFGGVLPEQVGYRGQGDGDLGDRLSRAFAWSRAAGHRGAVAIGADTPHLPLEWLDRALAAVAAGSVVLGPARDGGYYLIGLPSRHPEVDALFGAGDWGTRFVLSRTRAALRTQGVSWEELPEFWDIDEASDLVQWKRQLQDAPMAPPAATHSLALLREL